MKTNVTLLVALLIGLMSTQSSHAQWGKIRRELTHFHQLEHIRVFYDTEGEHAIVQTDVDKNGVPDQVEDVAKQTWAAHKLFVDTLGFPNPLNSERYSAASYIDINLLSKKTVRGTYVSYDELQKFSRDIDDPQLNPDTGSLDEPDSAVPEKVSSLTFDISTSVDPNLSSSPTRAYFILIQNGATYFKNPWLSYGTSRWSNYVVAKGDIGELDYSPKSKFPQSQKNLERLFAMGTQSEQMIWNPIAKLDDQKGEIPKEKVAKEIQKMTYANGNPIIVDYKLTGAEIIRDVLIELGKMDDRVFKEQKYKSWKESNQRSEKNSPYIYEAIMNVARDRGHNVGEFKASDFKFPATKKK